MGPGPGSLRVIAQGIVMRVIMIVMTLTWGTGYRGAALVLCLLHDTVLTNWLDEWTHPGRHNLLSGLPILCRITSKNT